MVTAVESSTVTKKPVQATARVSRAPAGPRVLSAVALTGRPLLAPRRRMSLTFAQSGRRAMRLITGGGGCLPQRAGILDVNSSTATGEDSTAGWRGTKRAAIKAATDP
jgi:hypothetical protein